MLSSWFKSVIKSADLEYIIRFSYLYIMEKQNLRSATKEEKEALRLV